MVMELEKRKQVQWQKWKTNPSFNKREKTSQVPKHVTDPSLREKKTRVFSAQADLHEKRTLDWAMSISYQHVECFRCDPLLRNSNYYWVHAVDYHHPTHSSGSLSSKEHGPMHMPMYSFLRKNCPSYVLGNYADLLELNIMTIYANSAKIINNSRTSLCKLQ